MRFTALTLLALLAAAPAPAQDSRPTSRPADAPEGDDLFGRKFKRLLPRGRIAAIRKPVYVTAADAKIRPDAWVLGLVIEGKPRAYSLNLLNRHEIVNDTIGGTPFAAVW